MVAYCIDRSGRLSHSTRNIIKKSVKIVSGHNGQCVGKLFFFFVGSFLNPPYLTHTQLPS